MRDILFRGKRLDKKDEWVEGGIVHQTDFYGDSVNRYYIIDGTDTDDNIGPAYRVHPDTIGQYTGLTVNGTKVFEGDIVAIPPNMSRKSTLGVVKFGDYKTPPYGVDKTNRGFYIRWYYENEAIEEMLRRDIVFWFNYSHVDISIIGNIHDNPELLEVAE